MLSWRHLDLYANLFKTIILFSLTISFNDSIVTRSRLPGNRYPFNIPMDDTVIFGTSIISKIYIQLKLESHAKYMGLDMSTVATDDVNRTYSNWQMAMSLTTQAHV